jgi:SAM-dependent methyltransferase
MTADEQWLAATSVFVRSHLPAAPARVVDLGCGRLGGFVPMLLAQGYDAVGIDPKAPAESHYQQVEFEHAELPRQVDAVVASTSLHHVADPAQVIDRIANTLTTGGAIVIVEWAWEKFDQATARWCFERLGAGREATWLEQLRDEWASSRQGWQTCFASWATREGLHRGEKLVRLLDERFERRLLFYGPYFFPDLLDTTDEDEQAAITAGQIRATRIDWVGTLR